MKPNAVTKLGNTYSRRSAPWCRDHSPWVRRCSCSSSSVTLSRGIGKAYACMPELPEVETIRTGLAPHVEGRRIEAAEILDVRLVMPELPAAVAGRLQGLVIERLERRGKYLVFRLSGEHVLICHLRMTGSFLWTVGAPERPPFTRAEVVLDDGSLLRYTDVRRFGTWALLDTVDGAAYIARRLGPEPLGPWSARELRRRLDGREAPIKAVLLDQRVVAGVGNIYADEALWRAQIH